MDNRYQNRDYRDYRAPVRREPYPQSGGRTSRRIGHKDNTPVWKLVLIDFIAAAMLILVFAYFHHVNPILVEKGESVALPVPSASAQTQTPEPSVPADTADPAEPSQSAPAESTAPADDTKGGIFLAAGSTPEKTDTSYKSENVSVTITDKIEYGCDMHIADIYVKDVKYLQTAFAGGEFNGAWSNKKMVNEQAKDVNAFVAVNGDQFAARREGVVVRNGVLYRETAFKDVCVLNYDGTLATYANSDFDLAALKENGAWQAWAFGPMLLKDGQAMTEFNSDVNGANPRTAIGMVEPLHYIIVTVDGRQNNSKGDYAAGISLADLSTWFAANGCKTAYNFDGGATAAMAVDGKLYSSPSKDRSCTDIIYVGME